MRPVGGTLIILGCFLGCGAALGGEVGGPIEVAPKAPETKMQMWPRAAWAAESKSWLVVWREGYVNEEATDVWCARVSVGGKALDPAGVKVCAAEDRQERACVASDGAGWLVVWEDFRNGKDYDVYAARVSAEGRVLDPDGFLVAGGKRNQCYPGVAFAGGNYVVVWMAYCGEAPDNTVKDGVRSGYKLYGTAVSPEGKVATPNGGPLMNTPSLRHALRPAVTAAGDGGRVLVAFNAYNERRTQWNNIGTLWVDGATCKVEVHWEPVRKDNPPDVLQGSPLSVAWGKEGGVLLSEHGGFRGGGARAWRLDASGARVLPKVGEATGNQQGFNPRYSIACDGEQYLITRDRVAAQKPLPLLGVQACLLPADWKGGDLDKQFFPVAGDGGKSCLMGRAAAGPKGAFLVTYTEARGVDDVKVLARLVGRPSASAAAPPAAVSASAAAPAAREPVRPEEPKPAAARPQAAPPAPTGAAREAIAPKPPSQPTPEVAARGLFSLAMSYARAGRPDKAREYLQKIIETYPGSEHAARARKELKRP